MCRLFAGATRTFVAQEGAATGGAGRRAWACRCFGVTTAAMVESMDYAQDVERLFSWLKAPMAHYREFTPQIEVAEAVATWPLAHKAAVQTGLASGQEPSPHGFAAIRERMARNRAMMPEHAAQAIREHPISVSGATGVVTTPEPAPGAAPTPGRAADVPDDGALRPPPVQYARADRVAPPPQPTPPPAARDYEPTRGPADPGAPPHATETPRPARGHRGDDRGGLFSGEYRDREPPPRRRGADRQDRSLEAVFSRLSGGRDKLPDPRERTRTSPGLGPVFGRLR